jgi:peptide chain release factor 3
LLDLDAQPRSPTPKDAMNRRTFAIISHPDAGKTTLTEKFLLYSGAIASAGSVKARRDRRSATSDWMEMEQQRGISITSTVLRFTYRDTVFNLLDTPGHKDFSEDTYRVLTAADAAIMVLDAAKGVEDRTLKLFEVCRQRGVPLLTFINKMDRPSLEPLQLLDDIRGSIGVEPVPMTWPVGIPGDFKGLIERETNRFVRFARTARGATISSEEWLEGGQAQELLGDDWQVACEETALLDAVGASYDEELFLAGEVTPTYFGSALSNFGVRLLLDALADFAPPPSARLDVAGIPRPLDAPFSGFVFKIQANMDPRHRDRIAFLRVCSGTFRRGMTATHHQSGRPHTMRYAHQIFGQERDTVDTAVPGDIVGLVNAGDLRIGDTLYEDQAVSFPPIPSFEPEHFRTAHNRDSSRYKQFKRGLKQLEEEGAIQVLRHADRGEREPLLAAVGPMQFEVVQHRMDSEFGAPLTLTPSPFKIARVTDERGEGILSTKRDAEVFRRSDGKHIALFPSHFHLEYVLRDHPELMLASVIESAGPQPGDLYRYVK